MTGWDHYLNAAKHGENKWYDWIGGFWLIFVGVNIAQIALLFLTVIIMVVTAPDLGKEFMSAAAATSTQEGPSYDSYFLIVAFITTALWVATRGINDLKTKQITAYIGLASMGLTIVFLYLQSANADTAEINSIMLKSMGVNPMLYASFLLSFPAILAVVFLIQKLWHKRTLTKLHTAFDRYNWSRTFFAIAVFWAIAGGAAVIGHFSGLSPLKLQFDSTRFFGFAIVSLMLIPLQSATEEIVVRGYMNQGFGQYIKSPWIVFLITSLFFMALHLANPEATSSAEKGAFMHVLTMSSYFSFGYLLCILVYFEGGLETAIGVHVANNLFAAIFINYEGSVLPTPSVYIASINPSYDLPIGMVMLGLITFILVKTRPNWLKAEIAKPVMDTAELAAR